MNIVYIGAFRLPNLDAAAPRVLNNAKAMRACGNSVTFISWGGTYRKEDLCIDGRYRVDGFEYIISGDLPLSNSFLERIKSKLTRGRKSINILKTLNNVDLVILYNADYNFTLKMIEYCSSHSIKLANDINEWFDNNELHFFDRMSNTKNMVYLQHKVKNKIVISSFFDKYYHSSNNILVPPLCDPLEDKWNNGISDERIPAFKGVTLIYAGTPAKKDYIHSVVNAVHTLATNGLPIRFLILGITKDKYLSDYSELVISNDLHSNIIFLGRVSQDLIPAYYKKADFMVLLREPNRKSMAGFPTKFAESVTAGVPVITNETSDLPKYVQDKVTGFLLKSFDYDSVLDTLQNVILSLTDEDINNMKKNVTHINKAFDWRTYINDFKLFLNNLE